MATKQEPIRRNDVIRCDKCGEDYSVTYKKCPFCDERPSRPRRTQGGRSSGRRVAGGGKKYGRGVNPLQIAALIGSLVVIIIAFYIVFSIISPSFGTHIIAHREGRILSNPYLLFKKYFDRKFRRKYTPPAPLPDKAGYSATTQAQDRFHREPLR